MADVLALPSLPSCSLAAFALLSLSLSAVEPVSAEMYALNFMSRALSLSATVSISRQRLDSFVASCILAFSVRRASLEASWCSAKVFLALEISSLMRLSFSESSLSSTSMLPMKARESTCSCSLEFSET